MNAQKSNEQERGKERPGKEQQNPNSMNNPQNQKEGQEWEQKQ